MQFTLFLKAGRSSPDSLGMCLPGQSAHLLAKIKSLAFQPRMMHLDNPPPEFSSVGFQRLPAVLHSDGNGVDEDVVKDLAAKYPEGLLNPDPKDAAKAENVTKYIYPKFCEYMHGGDISELEAALQGLEQYLREGEHNFLFGDEIKRTQIIGKFLCPFILGILKRKHIIENKRPDSASVNEKRQCWEEICTFFNASHKQKIAQQQLKELYFVLKRNARKHNNEDKMGHLQTGGGQFTPKSDDIDLKIVGGLKDQFEPDENRFNSSAIISDEVVPVVNDIDTPEASCVCITSEEPHSEVVTLPVDAATSSDIAPQDMPSRSKRKSSLDIVKIEHKNRCANPRRDRKSTVDVYVSWLSKEAVHQDMSNGYGDLFGLGSTGWSSRI
ncbi:hypothetical protein C0J52_19853 [Blattella germanica]|nr:hypothetical protein C0J52_19853 [Blattella germanica]